MAVYQMISRMDAKLNTDAVIVKKTHIKLLTNNSHIARNEAIYQ